MDEHLAVGRGPGTNGTLGALTASEWRPPAVLCSGQSEGLKAAVHALALATAALCAGYNLAAWLCRRQKHLAINAVVYTAAVVWEAEHVRHHLAGRLPQPSDHAVDAPILVIAASMRAVDGQSGSSMRSALAGSNPVEEERIHVVA